MLTDLLVGLGQSVAYAAIGVGLMGLGFLLVDVLTPGHLGHQIYTDRNRNAALVLGAAVLGIGIIVATAILTSANDFGEGLLTTAGYGLIGLVAMAVSFLLLDLLTPGKLGEIVVSHEVHPAAWVSAANNLALSLIVAAAIS